MKPLISIPLVIVLFCCTQSTNQSAGTDQESCEWCGATEAPSDVSWQTIIAGRDEPGERIKISGTAYENDGETPAKNITMYLYHTNSKGIYPKKGDETGNGIRHGYLRGWVKTNESGEYAFETIKPAAYPGRTEPAHIHVTIKEPGKEEYWLKSYLFQGDELLSSKDLVTVKDEKRFNHVIELTLRNGILVGERDILLKN